MYWQEFFKKHLTIVLIGMFDQNQESLVGYINKLLRLLLKFFVFDHDMPCSLKQGHLALQLLKPSYLHYRNAYDHQIWQGGDLPREPPTQKFIWPFDYVVWQDQILNKNYLNFTTRVAMATKIFRMANYLDGLLLIKSHDHFITWRCEMTKQTKTIISLLSQCLWKPTW